MLVVNDIKKIFYEGTQHALTALSSVSFSMQQGDVVMVIGSNGAGKSTLLNIIAGSLFPSSGGITFDGMDITTRKEHRRARVMGRLFQNPLLGTAEELSIEENLAIALSKASCGLSWAIRKKLRRYIQEKLVILEMGLENRLHAKVATLSGGERQALSLLMIALKNPQLLLLDEHTAALDPYYSEKILLLTEYLIRENNMSAVIVTHNMKHALQTGTRLFMMHKGVILYSFDTAEKEKQSITSLVALFSKEKDAINEDELLFQ